MSTYFPILGKGYAIRIPFPECCNLACDRWQHVTTDDLFQSLVGLRFIRLFLHPLRGDGVQWPSKTAKVAERGFVRGATFKKHPFFAIPRDPYFQCIGFHRKVHESLWLATIFPWRGGPAERGAEGAFATRLPHITNGSAIFENEFGGIVLRAVQPTFNLAMRGNEFLGNAGQPEVRVDSLRARVAGAFEGYTLVSLARFEIHSPEGGVAQAGGPLAAGTMLLDG